MNVHDKHSSRQSSHTALLNLEEPIKAAERHQVPLTTQKKKQLMLAGGFALGAGVFLLIAPELGVVSAVGGLGLGLASAVTTFIARH